ncbi:MAG: riboflavin biosynthesis protein RibD [bacterium]|nr:MAG: riboflavin biosynthesis protein RibD [bacterium]
MRHTLHLAKKGRGFTAPNPMVGATIVKDGKIIGEGWHELFGGPHAEINAMRKAVEPVRDATLYVSLEPCSYYGKTPACSPEIIKQGFKKVVVAILDPNPLVAGRGVELLRHAGIEVKTGLLEAEARQLNERFFKFIQTQIPFVAVKTAASLDGKIATSTGDSKWITNELSRRFVHQLRNDYMAVMVGVNTVLKDNPLLTSRIRSKKTKQPIRIIVDSQLKTPENAPVLDTRVAPAWMAVTARSDKQKRAFLQQKGIEIILCPEKDGHVDMAFLMAEIGKKGIDSVLVEGGGTLNFSLFQQQQADKVYAFIAPKIIGGKEAITPVEGAGFKEIAQVPELKQVNCRRFGNDVLIEAYL